MESKRSARMILIHCLERSSVFGMNLFPSCRLRLERFLLTRFVNKEITKYVKFVPTFRHEKITVLQITLLFLEKKKGYFC